MCYQKIVVVSSPGDCPLRKTGHCLVEGTDDKTLDIVLLKGLCLVKGTNDETLDIVLLKGLTTKH